ncbi:hypothetical protein ACQP1O_22860 [Nocardia sp. CA-151230]|uniref:hypothetical protein n=1 Tax=Nocardia sp. CA-151230 TaxID=3239982 RepID=UPI003D8FF3A6
MIYPSVNSITSSIAVFEWAQRRPDCPEPAWELSWRPRPLLTREQALAAMELTEILCTPLVGSDTVWRRVQIVAAELDIDVEAACDTLRRRRQERGDV